MADLPIAGIVCLAAGGYTALILIIVCVRYILVRKGVCTGEGCCNPCGKEGGGQCSDCCISISEGCNCCNPSVDGCLNSICPNRKSLSCVDILLCQCFGNCFSNPDDENQEECFYCPCICPDLYFCGCNIHCMSRGERRLPRRLVLPVTSDFNHETIVTMDQKTFVLVEVGPDDHIPSQSALGGSPSFRHSPSRIPFGGSSSFRTSPSHIPLDGSTSFRTSPSRSPIGRGPSFRSTNV